MVERHRRRQQQIRGSVNHTADVGIDATRSPSGNLCRASAIARLGGDESGYVATGSACSANGSSARGAAAREDRGKGKKRRREEMDAIPAGGERPAKGTASKRSRLALCAVVWGAGLGSRARFWDVEKEQENREQRAGVHNRGFDRMVGGRGAEMPGGENNPPKH